MKRVLTLSALVIASAGQPVTGLFSPHADAAIPHPFSAAQPLQILVVATNGHDTTGNGSPGAPFRTIARAAQSAVPGTEIRLLPGDYPGGAFIYDLHGTLEHPIWIRGADPAQRPRIVGGSEALHLVRAQCVIIQHLEVTGATANGINCDDGGDYANTNASRFLVFSDLILRDIGGNGNQDGLKLSGIRDFFVLNSEIARCGGNQSGSGIDMVGCHRGLIAGNTLHTFYGNAIQAKGGSSDIEIRRNIISHPGHRGINIGGATGFEFFRPPLSSTTPNVEAHDIRIVANVFIGGTSTVAFAGSTNCLVAHNTILEPSRWVFRILQETTSSGGYSFAPCGGNRFRNNIVYYRHAVLNRYVNEGPNTDPASFLVQHNLWYPLDQPGAAPHPLPGTVSGNRYGLDPGFLNPVGGDYRITLASPAATNGWNSGPETDFDGIPFLTPPAIGAFEISGDVDGDTLPDYWEMTHWNNLTHGPHDDPDGDGVTNRDEHTADTNPTDAASFLGFIGWDREGDVPVAVWRGGRHVAQMLEAANTPDATAWMVLTNVAPPTAATNRISLPNAPGGFLRVRAGDL
ncbi:MAG TPA: hypothetical protein PKA21_06715 [Kiritimatiellia bacterium]|nr:hypothetical protein [Kiritimatiellia bacterium]HMP97429.1 hypothetical protein [Kiritimatiellia bacterium]